MTKHFALPLFALVDRQKVDPDTSDLQSLAAQLGNYLAHNFAIKHTAISIEGVAKPDGDVDLYLLLADVPQDGWSAVMALADAQKASLYLCEIATDGTNRFMLTPLSGGKI